MLTEDNDETIELVDDSGIDSDQKINVSIVRKYFFLMLCLLFNKQYKIFVAI